METLQELSLEERKANVSKLINRWKENKKQSEEESKKFVQSPEFQKIKNDLRERNARRGTIIPKI
jgi:hypothetical protein